MDFFEELLLEIKNTAKNKGLNLSVLAKQIRLRVEYLTELFEKESDQKLTLPQIRQIRKLVEFLKIDFDKKLWNKEYGIISSNQIFEIFKLQNTNLRQRRNVFYVFTLSNFNTLVLSIVTIVVIILVGLPVFLVVRPAEVIWLSQNVNNNIISITKPLENIKGNTKRAKSMVFGGQTVLLKNGEFELDLPKPDKSVVVPLRLTNYFNLTTDYNIIINPTI